MCTVDSLRALSDDDLLQQLEELAAEQADLTARIVAHLALVEERKLHLDLGYSSLFVYCVERLRFSEDAAYRRIRAARLLKRCPAVLPALADGKVSLTALGRIAPHLAAHPELLTVAEGKSIRELDLLLAERFPSNSSRNQPGTLRPLGDGRYRLEVVVSGELAEKIEKARDLCRHRIPDGNLADVLERAVDLLLSKVEKERFARVKKARAGKGGPTRTVPARVKREVYERDGGRCSFVAADGRRCNATAFIEFDHTRPRALGGEHSTENGRMLCHSHNQRAAELALGRETMARATHRRLIEQSLKTLGFDRAEANRAVVHALRVAAPGASLEELLRAALATLAPPSCIELPR